MDVRLVRVINGVIKDFGSFRKDGERSEDL